MSEASNLIRDSIAALPVRPDDRWVAYEDGLIWADGWDGAVLAGDPMAGSQHLEIARHIALLASPDVAGAVADLLDAIPPGWDMPRGFDPWKAIADILGARDALEAALTRRGA